MVNNANDVEYNDNVLVEISEILATQGNFYVWERFERSTSFVPFQVRTKFNMKDRKHNLYPTSEENGDCDLSGLNGWLGNTRRNASSFWFWYSNSG